MACRHSTLPRLKFRNQFTANGHLLLVALYLSIPPGRHLHASHGDCQCTMTLIRVMVAVHFLIRLRLDGQCSVRIAWAKNSRCNCCSGRVGGGTRHFRQTHVQARPISHRILVLALFKEMWSRVQNRKEETWHLSSDCLPFRPEVCHHLTAG